LRSFEKNRISFEQADLPLSASLESRDTIVVPGFRRGVLVSFDVGSSSGALLTVEQSNGEPLPAGAVIRHMGSTQRFPVARRGEAWVTDLKDENQLVAQWGEQSCYFAASMPSNLGPMPSIGPLVCQKELP
jgi:outer membrane usher protein